VYGDRPNELPLIELETRYEIDSNHPYYIGIDESMSIDQSKHSLFGASKASADLFVQEYGRYFGLKTACFRGGCLTGPAHSPAELHGFLAYLVKCIATGKKYSIFDTRENRFGIITYYDLVHAFYHFFQKPRIGEVTI
jgi:CDP-paratose 2-epimerase